MSILFWLVVLYGTCYSFWYAYYLLKAKNKLGALGITLVGLLITLSAFMVKMK